jgi:hypothetical protein
MVFGCGQSPSSGRSLSCMQQELSLHCSIQLSGLHHVAHRLRQSQKLSTPTGNIADTFVLPCGGAPPAAFPVAGTGSHTLGLLAQYPHLLPCHANQFAAVGVRQKAARRCCVLGDGFAARQNTNNINYRKALS